MKLYRPYPATFAIFNLARTVARLTAVMLSGLVLVSPLTAQVAVAQTPAVSASPIDLRPAFDKAPYAKTVWCQANPWWQPDRPAVGGRGGTDYAWDKYPSEPVPKWAKVAQVCRPYGLDGLAMELLVDNQGGGADVYLSMLDGFRQAGNGMMGEIMLTNATAGGTVEIVTRNMLATFDKIAPAAMKHPNSYRLDGAPVVMVYNPSTKFTAVQWQQVISTVESKYGRFIWLLDANNRTAQWLDELLPVFDGVTYYANFTEAEQRRQVAAVAELMRRAWPQKIFQAPVHTTFTSHFWYGGLRPELSAKLRHSWEISLDYAPDSIVVTNLFDTQENSRVLPSYELDDLMLRVSQAYIEKWRGTPFSETREPDLYVTNYLNVLLGQPLRFEVVGLPLAGTNKQVAVELSLCDSAGRKLHQFPSRTITLDEMRVLSYEIPSLRFKDQLALHPNLVCKWSGGPDLTTGLLPPTNLQSSMLPQMLFWARSYKRLICMSKNVAWSMEDSGPGGQVLYSSAGQAVLRADLRPLPGEGPAHRGDFVRMLRNGRELGGGEFNDTAFVHAARLPNPVGALDWYNLEMVNRSGSRYLSAPIWVHGGARSGQVQLPILDTGSGTISQLTLAAQRVPYFQYDCDRDTGTLLVDSSGYDHHGRLGGQRVERRFLNSTGYRFEHEGRSIIDFEPATMPAFGRDDDKRGYLRFDGVGTFAGIFGGTAFPYASTYEISIRPRRTGKLEGLLGAPNNQIQLFRDEQGRILARRNRPFEGEGGSAVPESIRPVEVRSQGIASIGRWTRIAVVYDLKKLALYIDGQLQGAVPCAPAVEMEWLNPVFVGTDAKFPFDPGTHFFQGDVRRIRIYGRNLSRKELLPE